MAEVINLRNRRLRKIWAEYLKSYPNKSMADILGKHGGGHNGGA